MIRHIVFVKTIWRNQGRVYHLEWELTVFHMYLFRICFSLISNSNKFQRIKESVDVLAAHHVPAIGMDARDSDSDSLFLSLSPREAFLLTCGSRRGSLSVLVSQE